MEHEKENGHSNSGEESFEDLLLAYECKERRQVRVGDRVQAEVLSIGRENVFVDTGTMMDGVVDKAELLDDQGQLTCKIGDRLELYVVSVSDGEVRLSRALTGSGGLRALNEAFENGVPVEGKVIARCKGGYEVNLMQRRAFCPASQMDLRYTEDGQEFIGKTYRFLLTQFDEGGRNIVVSRRKLLERELQEARKEFLAEIREGQILEGTVTRLAQFGVFVEIFPGIEGMVHVSELSWSRVRNPNEVVRVSEKVKVRVMKVEGDVSTGKARISLSIKGASPDPWRGVESVYKVGQIVEGKVGRCTSFGAFVEVEPGVEGLVHISEMSYTRRVLKPEELVSPGDTIKVIIKEIDLENRRISLSMKDVEGDPWAEIFERYKEGQVVNGRLERKEDYGYFVSLEPGVTGLIPKTAIERSPYATELEKAREGDIISVFIKQINQPEKRITLEPRLGTEEDDWQSYRDAKASFGSLGEKLLEALRKKKNGN